MVQSNLPANDFTGKSINDSGKVDFPAMKIEFSEITSTNDIWSNRRNAFGPVRYSTDRFVTAILRLSVTNTWSNTKLDHDTMRTVFTNT